MTTEPSSAQGVVDAATPARIGRFAVSRRLGASGTGVVYAAHDPTLDRSVAIKVLHDDGSGGDDGRLLREAQALARLSHPHVIAVYEVGEHHGRAFLAMELVDGVTLTRWLCDRPRRWTVVRDVLLQAGRGIAAAHHAGFVHRDFKPDNVLVGRDGRVRVTNFGLARLGTPANMAPEQLHGRTADARADQFAFCATVFEALAGARPFAGDDPGELRVSIDRGEVRELRGDAPAAVRRALRRGLAADPAARHPSFDALLAILAREPARWRRRVAIAVPAIAVALAGAWLLRAGPAVGLAPCGGAQARLDAVWNDDARRAAHQAFTATGTPFAEDSWHAAERDLDDYAARWVRGHEDACTATAVRREQSEQLLDLRMSCLDTRIEELRAVSELLAGADAALVERAAGVAASLSELDECANRELLLAPIERPRDANGRTAMADIDRRLAVARARWAAGKVDEVVTTAADIVSDARRLDHLPTLARALLVLGLAQLGGERAAARVTLREAARTAEAGRADETRADALIALVHAVLEQGRFVGDRIDDALALADDADATVRRIGGDPRRQAHLALNLGSVYLAAGKLAEATTTLSRALELAEHLEPGEPYERARVLGELAWLAHDEGRHTDAIDLFRRAQRGLEDDVGARHPEMAGVLHNLALVLQEQGQLVEARDAFTRAIAISEAARGPDAPIVAMSSQALGDTLVALGQTDAALPHLERARRIQSAGGEVTPTLLHSLGRAEAALGHFAIAGRYHEEAHARLVALFGPDDREVAISHFAIGQLRSLSGEMDKALTHYREALRIDEHLFGPTGAILALDLELVGETELRLGRPAAAVTYLERTLTIAAAVPADRPDVAATAQFYLARALDELGRDPARARRLAEAALAYFAGAEVVGLLPQIEAWLAAHP